LALERLHLAEPVYRIVVGRRYGQKSWLFPAFTDICSRRDPLSWEEAELLGLEDTHLVGQIREAVWAQLTYYNANRPIAEGHVRRLAHVR
jgi:hypothetical protein